MEDISFWVVVLLFKDNILPGTQLNRLLFLRPTCEKHKKPNKMQQKSSLFLLAPIAPQESLVLSLCLTFYSQVFNSTK